MNEANNVDIIQDIQKGGNYTERGTRPKRKYQKRYHGQAKAPTIKPDVEALAQPITTMRTKYFKCTAMQTMIEVPRHELLKELNAANAISKPN